VSRSGRALRLGGAVVLVVALFLPWSHQFDASFLARFGASPALHGVPHDPNAWQLYTFADVLLGVLAVGVTLSAVRWIEPGPRWVWLLALAAAAAFTIHALLVVPTNGTNVFDPSRSAYAPTGASVGVGEWVALVGLALAAGGVLAPRRDP
jgi:hypothetical protein